MPQICGSRVSTNSCSERAELDLTDSVAVGRFFEQERPAHVFLAAAKVGGILANDLYPTDFVRENLLIQTNVIDACYVPVFDATKPDGTPQKLTDVSRILELGWQLGTTLAEGIARTYDAARLQLEGSGTRHDSTLLETGR